jgi:type II secretory pathway pseudopilin PulG
LRPSRLYAHVRTHDWFAVAIDFVIVVLGVYVAVWVSSQQQAREREQRTRKLVAALQQDMRDSATVDQKFDQALEAALTAFKAARQRGETPPPVFLRISGSDTPPRSPCQGALQAQIAELMDPTLLWEVCFYYDERDGTAQKYVRYAVFTENEILPRLKEDSGAFYTADRTRLAPAFASHMDRLQEWRRDVTTLHDWARCLDDRLREPAKAGPSCRPSVGGTIDVGGPK